GSTAQGRKFFHAKSSADWGRPSIVMAETSLQTKTPPRPRTSGVVVPPWLRTESVPHTRRNGRIRSGSRATFRTWGAAPFHQLGAFSIALGSVLLPVAAGC